VPAEAFEKMFGLKVAKDSEGCLQDIHWSIGLLGYFPTYTLGNLNAAQLMRRATQENVALESELAQGEYGSLLQWLRANIHRHGSRHRPQQLMQLATGETTQSSYYQDYLRKKFAGT
jgi:carboxypeptidase Taq